jgi:hypothetical protein
MGWDGVEGSELQSTTRERERKFGMYKEYHTAAFGDGVMWKIQEKMNWERKEK